MMTVWEWYITIKSGDLMALKKLLALAKLHPAESRLVDIINTRFKNETLLTTAIKSGYLDIARLLLTHGADPHLKSAENGRNEPPLITATRFKKLDMVKILVENGATVSHTAFYGQDAIFQAVVENAFEILEYFLEINHSDVFTHEFRNCPVAIALKYSKNHLCKRKCLFMLLKYRYKCSCYEEMTGDKCRVSTSTKAVPDLDLALTGYICVRAFKSLKSYENLFLFEQMSLFNLTKNCVQSKLFEFVQNKGLKIRLIDACNMLSLPGPIIKSLANTEGDYENCKIVKMQMDEETLKYSLIIL